MRGIGPNKRPTALIFQNLALFPLMSVADNIAFGLEVAGVKYSERRRRAEELLNLIALPGQGDKMVSELSGGQKQRVAIARALAVNPAVMLMDEPLSALDSQTRELLMDDLVALWTRTPFAAVYVTHNLAEAVRLGHQIVVLSRRPGRIREVVRIDKPLAERGYADADLEAKQKHLWTLMREEARAADAELLNV